MGLELEAKVVIVTGAGRGLGRSHALELALNGAHVVVNDLDESADTVVREITAAGGKAVANHDNCASWAGAERLIEQTIKSFGDLHALINNAGILRDRMIFNMSEDEWDAVISVHGKGHFAPTRFACSYWREKAKTTGGQVYGRIVHTTSRSGLYGGAGQSNYAFAKAGIGAFSLVVARDMERYGVTSNAVSPIARTRLTEGTFGEIRPEGKFDRWDPANVSPFVCFLCSEAASGISGQIFVVFGGEVQLVEQYQPARAIDKGARWTVSELSTSVGELFQGRSAGPPDRRAIPGLRVVT